MPKEPLEPPNEHHWWEMQLGLRLPRSLRHPSPLVRIEPDVEDVAATEESDAPAGHPPDERQWWEKQLGKKVSSD